MFGFIKKGGIPRHRLQWRVLRQGSGTPGKTSVGKHWFFMFLLTFYTAFYKRIKKGK